MSQDARVQKARSRLMAYAIRWLAEWSGQDVGPLLAKLPDADDEQLGAYRSMLSQGRPNTEPGQPLLSIFAQVRDPESKAEVPRRYWQAAALSLEALPQPADEAGARQADGRALWQGFAEEAEAVLRLPAESGARFEAFGHLLHRWAWAVPATYRDEGVSLYEEFRALSALVHAERSERGNYMLVGGDIPGIQGFVYTITSKGAVKGLRGRSVFLQLLGDAAVWRLLAELDLAETNVVYAAGGNFLILAPAGDATEAQVRDAVGAMNGTLVKASQGEMALVVQCMPVDAADLFAADRFRDKRKQLARRIAAAKGQLLRELAGDWALLFEPEGSGSDRSCAVCRTEVDEQNSKPLEPAGEASEPIAPGSGVPRICYLCDSFGELARAIRHDRAWMAIRDAQEMRDTALRPDDGWAEVLARMTGFHYSFSPAQPKHRDRILAINRTDFDEAGAGGFRLLANVTPQTTAEDVAYLRDKTRWPEEDLPRPGEIRSFALLAHAASRAGAIDCVGVLRMDVDSLGRTFSEGMPDMTMPKLSALSAAMERFFAGHLNKVVQEQAGNDAYIIYAGGDDLFIVGAWHRLPGLARAIRSEFKKYVGDHPALSLSGGLTLEGARFPLYRAAERAGEAEHEAKAYTRPDGRRKDAFCFLGTVADWDEWNLIREQKDELLWLIGALDNPEGQRRLPRALLQIVQSIHRLYLTDLQAARRQARREKKEQPDPRLFFGRWMWLKVYGLSRLAERGAKHVPDARERMRRLQRTIMNTETVRLSGVAARWAEYSTRKEAD